MADKAQDAIRPALRGSPPTQPGPPFHAINVTISWSLPLKLGSTVSLPDMSKMMFLL